MKLVMNVTAFAKWTGTVLLLFTLGACGGSDDGGGGPGPQPAGTVIGTAGGTVIGLNGARANSAGALALDTTIAIEATTAGSPALPGTFSALGQMFAFTPPGARSRCP